MKRRQFTINMATALIMSAVLVLVGCASPEEVDSSNDGKPVAGGILQYAVTTQPTGGGFDPMTAAGFANFAFMEQIYQTLLSRDDNGNIIPELAESYEQVDTLTYNFKLRSDAKFSNGDVLTPEDVVYTFESYLTATTPRKSFLKNLDTITDIGDNTVQFKFSAPNGMFLNAVSNKSTYFVVQKEWYSNATKDQREREALGTGPFVLEEWVDAVSIDFIKNEHYWKPGQPYVDGIRFQIVKNESTILALVQQGSVDVAWFNDSTLAMQAKNSGYVLGDLGYTKRVNIFINPESGPLQDVRVRQALSLALDRQQLIDIAAGDGMGQLSLSVVSGDPLTTKVTADTPNYTRDIDKAKSLLAAAGQPNPTIRLAYPSDLSPEDIPIFEAMKQQAADAGITLDLVGTPWSELTPIFTFGESFSDMVAIWTVANADYTGYFQLFIGDGGPYTHWQDNPDASKAREMLLELESEVDLAKRKQLSEAINLEIAEQVLIIIPMTKPQTLEVWNGDKVKNYKTDPFSFRNALQDAWLVP